MESLGTGVCVRTCVCVHLPVPSLGLASCCVHCLLRPALYGSCLQQLQAVVAFLSQESFSLPVSLLTPAWPLEDLWPSHHV